MRGLTTPRCALPGNVAIAAAAAAPAAAAAAGFTAAAAAAAAAAEGSCKYAGRQSSLPTAAPPFISLFSYLFRCGLLACLYVMCMNWLRRAEEGARSPKTRVTDSFELSCSGGN